MDDEYISEFRRMYDKIEEINKTLIVLSTNYEHTCRAVESLRVQINRLKEETPEKINQAVLKPWSTGKKVLIAISAVVTFFLSVFGAVGAFLK